ncbi:MAG: ribbon-helix-helix protein, CopG family [Ahniella sp.]|nr:ribbon-helix-helix protein, CopG family [Ahniella sp.]
MGVTTVRLQPDVEEGLDAVSIKLQRTKSWLINQALREYIGPGHEAELRWRETLEAIDSVEAGRVLSGKSVHDWLRSWGTAEEQKTPKGNQ